MSRAARLLEDRAGQLATMLTAMTHKGHAARQFARGVLIANGETGTARLDEAETVTCPLPELLAVAKMLETWVYDVRALAGAEHGEEIARQLRAHSCPHGAWCVTPASWTRRRRRPSRCVRCFEARQPPLPLEGAAVVCFELKKCGP